MLGQSKKFLWAGAKFGRGSVVWHGKSLKACLGRLCLGATVFTNYGGK
jgi:hypothetical protein